MRIISGKLKGRRLNLKLPAGIRPTSDSTKETIFNILNNKLSFEGIRVLDLCSGSGGLGFEALSRGANYCCFVDKSKSAAEFIRRAGEIYKIDKNCYDMYVLDILKYIRNFAKDENKVEFDLVFCDPPYASNLLMEAVTAAVNFGLIKKDGIFVGEMSSLKKFDYDSNWELISERNSGETKIIFLRRKISSD